MENRCCNKCGIDKPLTKEYFYLRNTGKFHYRCILCYRDDVKANNSKPENKIRKQNYDIERRSKPEVIQKKRAHYEYYYSKEENILKRKINCKIYNSNPDNAKRRREQRKRRYDTDPQYKFRRVIEKHIRSVEKRDDFKNEWNDVMNVYVMYGIDYHIDHKIPKNWFKSTTPKNIVNDLRNLQVIDAVYNLSKQDYWADPVSDDYLKIIIPYIRNNYINNLAVSN